MKKSVAKKEAFKMFPLLDCEKIVYETKRGKLANVYVFYAISEQSNLF